jgi:hypothetical protein
MPNGMLARLPLMLMFTDAHTKVTSPGFSRYRSSDAMPDDRIRDFVRNWAPDARRTPNGYMKARIPP